jgi:hypothetical protein
MTLLYLQNANVEVVTLTQSSRVTGQTSGAKRTVATSSS